jgi:hypothetical protein
VKPEHVFVADHRDGFGTLAEPGPEACEQSPPDVDLERLEEDVFSAVDQPSRHLLVKRVPLVEETPELGLVARERPAAVAYALPRITRVNVDPDRERAGPQQLACALRENGPTPQRDHRRRRRSEYFRSQLLFDAPELCLAALEQLRNGTVATLDLPIEVDERPAAEARDLLADRRLPRTHEPHECEMTAERAYLGDQSIRSR